MVFTRKENRPGKPVRMVSPFAPRILPVRSRGGRALPAGPGGGSEESPRRGGKAPFKCRALALSLLTLPLFSLLFFSFHSLSSPALAAGEGAPSFQWPARGEVIQPFRPARGSYGAGGHAGIDIALPNGSEVRASAGGKVSFVGGTPVGLCVSLVHEGDYKTTYVSLQSAAVRRGQRVEAGQLLGKSDGAKDRSTSSPHLHFGLFFRDVAVDPLPFLQGRLLDPGKSLFLGPWEDRQAVETYINRHGGGGFIDRIERGLKSMGGAAGRAFKSVVQAVGRAMDTAWRWACRAADAVGKALAAFYRVCIKPWVSPLWNGLVRTVKAVLSNRFVQAVLAGLAAAAVVCLAVVGIGLAMGLSMATLLIAAAVGSVAAVGYGVYYAFAAGDSFSFLGCFLGSLAVGGVAATACLLFSSLAPVMEAGWTNLGWLGFGKSFLAHGVADLAVYALFCVATGRKISPWGLMASFFIGGLTGGLGKLVINGLFAQGAVQGLAVGFLSSGGTMLSGEGIVQAGLYASSLTTYLGRKISYMFLCGCMGFLGDVALRALTGGRPSVLESCLSFGGGFLAGGMSLVANGKGMSGILARLSGGRWEVSSELARALVSKSISRGLKEGAGAFLRRVNGRRSRWEQGLRWLHLGGD